MPPVEQSLLSKWVVQIPTAAEHDFFNLLAKVGQQGRLPEVLQGNLGTKEEWEIFVSSIKRRACEIGIDLQNTSGESSSIRLWNETLTLLNKRFDCEVTYEQRTYRD